MNICLSCDDKYSKYAGVVIASILLKSNVDEDFSFYILDSNISQENKDKISRARAYDKSEKMAEGWKV